MSQKMMMMMCVSLCVYICVMLSSEYDNAVTHKNSHHSCYGTFCTCKSCQFVTSLDIFGWTESQLKNCLFHIAPRLSVEHLLDQWEGPDHCKLKKKIEHESGREMFGRRSGIAREKQYRVDMMKIKCKLMKFTKNTVHYCF